MATSLAQRDILDAANRYIRSRNGTPLNRRQVQRAVAVVRHNRLVKPEVLAAGGYRTIGRPVPQRTKVLTVRQHLEGGDGPWSHRDQPRRLASRSWTGRAS